MRKFVIVTSILLLSGTDLGIKYVLENMYDITRYTPLIWEYLGLNLSYNSGVAFSLPIRGILLQIITVLIFFFLLNYYIKEEYQKHSKLIDVAYILIFWGAVSHVYERIFVGHVVDYIAVKYFAILNFADIVISVGAIILVFVYGFSGSRHRK